VKNRILLGALAIGAFLVTLAFSTWHEGFWHPAPEPLSTAAPQLSAGRVMPTRPVAASAPNQASDATAATAPSMTAPVATAVNTPAAIAPLEAPQGEPQYEQIANPGIDSEAMRRDRGVQHSPAAN